MENLKYARGPRRLVGRLAVAGLLGAALATIGFVGTAAADTITFTGVTRASPIASHVDDFGTGVGRVSWHASTSETFPPPAPTKTP